MCVNKLTKVRKNKGMTISELARKSGVSMGYICHLEKGTRKNPSKEIMEKISFALDEKASKIFF